MKRKIFPNVELLMPALSALTYEELQEVEYKFRGSGRFGECHGLINQAYERETAGREARWAKEAKERKVRQAAEAEEAPKRIKLLLRVLGIGDRVKLTGTKSGGGYREITLIDKNRETITGWKLIHGWTRSGRGGLDRSPSNIVTTNGIDKITHLFDKTTETWLSVKGMLSNYEHTT